VFGDPSSEECTVDDPPKFCRRQFLETARLSVTAAPWSDLLEAQNATEGVGIYWVLAPTFRLFYDTALNDSVVLSNGTVADGSVFGGAPGVTLAVSPGLFANKWEFAITGQFIEAFSRDQGRAEDFGRSTGLFKTSVQYALADTFIGQGSSVKNKWLPTIGLSYTNGGDPLNGRLSQKTIEFSVQLKF
jgi:hypothetical protein